MTHDYIANAITEAFGERCPDLVTGCPCCEAWSQYDDFLIMAMIANRNEWSAEGDRIKKLASYKEARE